MKLQTQQERSTSFSTISNRQRWLTFSMEETMKHTTKVTNKGVFMKKAWLSLGIVAVLLFSACSQQPTPEVTTSEELTAQGGSAIGGALDATVSQDAYNPSIAISNGNPVVAFTQTQPNSKSSIFVRRWVGAGSIGTWEFLLDSDTGVLNETPYGGSTSIAIDGTGNPIVALTDGTHDADIRLKRWNGSDWKKLSTCSTTLKGSLQYATSPSLALSSSGNPTVAYTGAMTLSGNRSIYVKMCSRSIFSSGFEWWNFSALSGYASGGLTSNDAVSPSLVLNSSGNPVVAYQEKIGGSWDVKVKRLNGANWESLGGSVDKSQFNDAEKPVLFLQNNLLLLAWQEKVNGQYNVYVRVWSESQNQWLDIYGTNSLDLSASRSAENPSIAWSGIGPVVSWQETLSNGHQAVFAKRWGAWGWSTVEGYESFTDNLLDAENPAIAVNSSGKAFIVSDLGVSTVQHDVYVRRY